MSFASLSRTKQKLRIPESNTTRDSEVEAVVRATNAWITRQTGLSASSEDRVEHKMNVQADVPMYMDRRPVGEVYHVKARRVGQQFEGVPYDVINPQAGLIVVHSYSGHGSGTMLDNTHNAWSAWRMGGWPVVEVSYQALASDPVPEDLADAGSALASYWYSRHLQNNVVMVGMGSLIERYSIDSVPVHISTILSDYMIEKPIWV